MKITWLIEDASYTTLDIEIFSFISKNLIDAVPIKILDVPTLIKYLNNGNETKRDRLISGISWFGHVYYNIDEDTPFLAFGKNFRKDLNHRFRKRDISKLNPNIFYLNFYNEPNEHKSLFFTCNTDTGDKDSFAYKWYSHLYASVRACEKTTSYEEIMCK